MNNRRYGGKESAGTGRILKAAAYAVCAVLLCILFITAAVFQAVIMFVSAVSYLLICRRKKRLSKDESEN